MVARHNAAKTLLLQVMGYETPTPTMEEGHTMTQVRAGNLLRPHTVMERRRHPRVSNVLQRAATWQPPCNPPKFDTATIFEPMKGNSMFLMRSPYMVIVAFQTRQRGHKVRQPPL